MTRLTVNPGICGFIAVIAMARLTKQEMEMIIKSDCEKVFHIGTSLTQLG
jgi:hypothetical protein